MWKQVVKSIWVRNIYYFVSCHNHFPFKCEKGPSTSCQFLEWLCLFQPSSLHTSGPGSSLSTGLWDWLITPFVPVVHVCVCGGGGGQNMTYLFCMKGGGSSFSSLSFPEHTSGPLHACPDFYSDKWSHFWKSVTSVIRKSGGEAEPLSWSLLVCVYKEAHLCLSQQGDAYFRRDDELLYLMWGRSTEDI